MSKSYVNKEGFCERFPGQYIAQNSFCELRGSVWRWRIQSSNSINKTFSFTDWKPNRYFDGLILDTEKFPAKWVEVKV